MLLLRGIEDGQLNAWQNAGEPVAIFCHPEPDLDCFAGSYLAWAYLSGPDGNARLWDGREFKRFRDRLAGLVDEIDRGAIAPADPSNSTTWVNFYTIFLFLDVHLKEKKFGDPAARPRYLSVMTGEAPRLLHGCHFNWGNHNHVWMAAALCLIHALWRLDPEGTHLEVRDGRLPSLTSLFDEASLKLEGWLAELLEGVVETTVKSIGAAVAHLHKATVLRIRVPESRVPVGGVFLTVSGDVAGTVAKLYRDRVIDGLPILVTAVALDDDPNRVIISVPPSRGVSLKGLGLALQRLNERSGCPATKSVRYYREVGGDSVPDPLFLHADPWYDGRDFGFTIVDAPRDPKFRLLTPDIVKQILEDVWNKLAHEYETAQYKNWLSGTLVPGP